MARLVFYDSSHTYEVDGEEVPSVSEIIRFISREVYGDVAQFHLDHAADRGTKVHKALEVLDKYGEVEITEDISPYVRAYLKFRKDHPCQWKYIEKPMCSPEKTYAGTLDRYGTVDGIPTILDFKTNKNIPPAHRQMYTAQQNLYRQALSEPVERILLLQLKDDETYKLYPLEIEDALANACLLLHQRLAKKKRKRKENVNGRTEATDPGAGTGNQPDNGTGQPADNPVE